MIFYQYRRLKQKAQILFFNVLLHNSGIELGKYFLIDVKMSARLSSIVSLKGVWQVLNGSKTNESLDKYISFKYVAKVKFNCFIWQKQGRESHYTLNF